MCTAYVRPSAVVLRNRQDCDLADGPWLIIVECCLSHTSMDYMDAHRFSVATGPCRPRRGQSLPRHGGNVQCNRQKRYCQGK
jgi:hypothetical protein